MPFLVRQLIEGRTPPRTVTLDTKAQLALEVMIEHDYSQLPVVDQSNQLQGMVTSDSILRALKYFGVTLDALHVKHALVRGDTYRMEDDLFDVLDALRDAYAVLIVDGQNHLLGILTSFDATEYFRRRAEDVMLIEDIETMVRDYIKATFTTNDGSCDDQAVDAFVAETLKSPKPFTKLTLYNYIELFLKRMQDHPIGAQLALAPDAMHRLLHSVRETRNILAHFRHEISAKQRDELRFCADWLARQQVRLSTTLARSTSMVGAINSSDVSAPITDRSASTLEQAITPTEEVLDASDSRYAPLAVWLQSQSSDQDRLQLSFTQIEEIMQDKLPASARKHRAWWANDTTNHVHAQQWLDVGWRVADVSLAGEVAVFVRAKEREQAYIGFFSSLFTTLRAQASFPVGPAFPDGRNWHTLGAFPQHGTPIGVLSFSFTRHKQFRVELYIDTGDYTRNKTIFDALFERRAAIEGAFGDPLHWERIDDRRASRIAAYHRGAITDTLENLVALQTWATTTMLRFQPIIEEHVQGVLVQLESGEAASSTST